MVNRFKEESLKRISEKLIHVFKNSLSQWKLTIHP